MTAVRAARDLWNRPYWLLVLTMLLWAGNAIASRFAVGEISPMAITCLRWAIVVVALLATGHDSIRHELPRLWPHRGFVFLCGALGFTAFNALFYIAGHHTSAVNIGLIQGVVPALVLVGSVVAYRSRIRLGQIAGLVVAIAGVVVATCRGSLDVLLGLDFNVGDVLMLAASCLNAGYAVALGRKPDATPLVLFAGMAIAALVTSVPLIAWEMARGETFWPTGRGWLVLAYIGLAPSLLGQITFMRGVELLGAARAGLFINLVPVFTAMLGIGLLGEAFGPANAVALALVLGGIALSEWGRPRPT